MVTVTRELYGHTSENAPVERCTMTNRQGMRVTVLNFGGILGSVEVPDRSGRPVDVVLGHETLEDYIAGAKYQGALVGRCANRIEKGELWLNGKLYQLTRNSGQNHLHGGADGFNRKLWKMKAVQDGVELSYRSPDGEEGYPGNLDVTVRYSLSEQNTLTLDYWAESDADTICNLTNHVYFNLAGQASETVLGQFIQINASQYTNAGPDSLPDGTIRPVEETPLDLRRPVRIGDHINDTFDQISSAGGYDSNWVLDGWTKAGGLLDAALAWDGSTGIMLRMKTTLPGVQFYTGNYLTGSVPGKQGASNGKHCGFCLESQYFPNSPAHPEFPSILLPKGSCYHETTVYEFDVVV